MIFWINEQVLTFMLIMIILGFGPLLLGLELLEARIITGSVVFKYFLIVPFIMTMVASISYIILSFNSKIKKEALSLHAKRNQAQS